MVWRAATAIDTERLSDDAGERAGHAARAVRGHGDDDAPGGPARGLGDFLVGQPLEGLAAKHESRRILAEFLHRITSFERHTERLGRRRGGPRNLPGDDRREREGDIGVLRSSFTLYGIRRPASLFVHRGGNRRAGRGGTSVGETSEIPPSVGDLAPHPCGINSRGDRRRYRACCRRHATAWCCNRR